MLQPPSAFLYRVVHTPLSFASVPDKELFLSTGSRRVNVQGRQVLTDRNSFFQRIRAETLSTSVLLLPGILTYDCRKGGQ